jgi:transposase
LKESARRPNPDESGVLTVAVHSTSGRRGLGSRWPVGDFLQNSGARAQLKAGPFPIVLGMDAIETLRQDVREGRLSAERLLDLIASVQRQLQLSQQQLHTALERIAELEKQLGGPTSKLDEPYSLRSEEQRQQARDPKPKKKARQGRRGRRLTRDKIAAAERREPVYPTGVAQEECQLSHTRPVWRLENGRAVLIAYDVYRGPNRQYGQIAGVLGRSEFGLEIVTQIAHLVYIVGLSFDKVCSILQFFENVHLKKSQADALLHRLARHWEGQFEALCTLLANSLVVHADETSWSLNSVWALLSEKARVLLFGVNKDGDTLKEVLDPATFDGLVVSDDAAVYANFSATQKCWAHLLRKAIKLTLQAPDDAEYRLFTDRLLSIYRAACRVQRDGRLSDAGRTRKVQELEDELLDLCWPRWSPDEAPSTGPANDYRLLVNELFRLLIDRELFAFVTTPPVKQPNGATKPVSGTNNEAERTLRGAATARKTGRTSKTLNGARRQTIVTSVLESLRVYLKTFTLRSVMDEIGRWSETGRSCFERLLTKLKLPMPEKTVLERLYSKPSPIPTG